MSYDWQLIDPEFAPLLVEASFTMTEVDDSQPRKNLTPGQKSKARDALMQRGYEVGNVESSSFDANRVDLGVEISVFSDEIGVGIVYWFKDKTEARTTFQHAATTTKELEQITGFVTYDPQLGKIVNWEADLEEMIAVAVQAITRFRSENSDLI
ncbi:MAG: hypothetical protein K8I82_26650 [Anaerolineae bacterium]|nr:hypothetical protein [Anaerolineae bacterium]